MIRLIRRAIRDESGDLDELPGYALCALVIISMISLVALFGRAASADNTVQAAAYAAARDRVRSRYGLPGDGEFLTRFMAPPQCHESARHERFCVIDTQHLASSYSSLDSMMTAYSDGTRSYAGAVSSCSYSADGSSCAERSDRFVWTIGPQGRLLAVDWLDANP